MTKMNTHKQLLGRKRMSFILDGGYDGRYRTNVVKSKRIYNRQKSKKITD